MTRKEAWGIIKKKFKKPIHIKSIEIIEYEEGTGVYINEIIGLLIKKSGEIESVNGMAKAITKLDYCEKLTFRKLEKDVLKQKQGEESG